MEVRRIASRAALVGAVVSVLAAGAAPRPAAGQEIRIQRTWHILPVGYGLEEVGRPGRGGAVRRFLDGRLGRLLPFGRRTPPDDGLGLARLAEDIQRRIEHDLPGVDVVLGPALRYEAADDVETLPETLGAEAADIEIGRRALARAEADEVVSRYDVALVFSPFITGHAGLAQQVYQGAYGEETRFAVVSADPARHVDRFLENNVPAGDDRTRRMVEALRPALARVLATADIRRWVVETVAVHEFGHFLAPGDLDVRDGYEAPWIGHGGDGSVPGEHGLGCIMDKEVSIESALAKLVRFALARDDFCASCHEALGIERP